MTIVEHLTPMVDAVEVALDIILPAQPSLDVMVARVALRRAILDTIDEHRAAVYPAHWTVRT